MGVRVLAGSIDSKKGIAAAVLYDSVTMTAFGPVMSLDSAATIQDLHELGNNFVDFIDEQTGQDPRKITDPKLHALYVAYLKTCSTEDDTEPAPKQKEGGAA